MPLPLQRALGFAVVEARGIGDELERFLRDLEVAQQHADEALHRRQVADRAADAAGHEGEHARIDAHGHLRRMAGAGEGVEHLADAHRLGIGQVEAVAVQLGLVRDVVHRVDDEIDRHDVDAPAFDAQHRHPRRQHFAQLLDQGEEVVRAVDLVDLAGLRMAHDHARAVDAPLDALLLAHQPFGIVLGAQVGIVQAFGLVEHVLAEHARIQAGGRDRTGVVEAAGLDRRGQVQRVAGCRRCWPRAATRRLAVRS